MEKEKIIQMRQSLRAKFCHTQVLVRLFTSGWICCFLEEAICCLWDRCLRTESSEDQLNDFIRCQIATNCFLSGKIKYTNAKYPSAKKTNPNYPKWQTTQPKKPKIKNFKVAKNLWLKQPYLSKIKNVPTLKVPGRPKQPKLIDMLEHCWCAKNCEGRPPFLESYPEFWKRDTIGNFESDTKAQFFNDFRSVTKSINEAELPLQKTTFINFFRMVLM